MKLPISTAALMTLASAALAQPIDCGRLLGHRAPFEAVVQKTTIDVDKAGREQPKPAETDRRQVLPRDSGREISTEIIANGKGRVRSEIQYGRPSSILVENGAFRRLSTMRYEDAIQRDRRLDRRDFTVRSFVTESSGDAKGDGKGPEIMNTTINAYLRDEVATVGNCTFKTIVYRTTNENGSSGVRRAETTASFSPDLGTVLSATTALYDHDAVFRRIETRVTDIRLDVTPGE